MYYYNPAIEVRHLMQLNNKNENVAADLNVV